MPSWKVHKWIDKLFLGKEHEDVHKFLDQIGVILNKGYFKGHRSKWGHTPEYVILVYLLTKGDVDKTLSAMLHQALDNYVDYKESKIFEKLIKLLEDKNK